MRIIRIAQCVAAAACLVSASPVFAGIQDSRFDISADKAVVKFDVKDVSRREVLARLFAGTAVELKWVNTAFADERIDGTFSGTQTAVMRELLSRADFIMRYDEKAQLSRVIIIGPASKNGARTTLAAVIPPKGPVIMQPVEATPVAAGAVRLDPVLATPVASLAVKLAPVEATPVAADAVRLDPVTATPVAMGAVRLAPVTATPVGMIGVPRR